MASYRDLKVYEKAYALVLEIYRATNGMPKEEQYGLKSQIRRASVSIPLNIAEGYGKMAGKRETARYLMMARGSCCEMEVLVSLLHDLGYWQREAYEKFTEGYGEVGKMLAGLIKTVTDN